MKAQAGTNREENEGTRAGRRKIKFTFLKHLLCTRQYGTYVVYWSHFHPHKTLGGMMWLCVILHGETIFHHR